VELVRQAATTDEDVGLGLYCLRLFCLLIFRQDQFRLGNRELVDPTLNSPELAAASRSAALAASDDEAAGWIRATEQAVAELEGRIRTLTV
jgi:hypothetical protein